MTSRPDLLSEEEIHSLGVQFVASYLDEQGSTVISTSIARLSNPQVVAHSAGQLVFIVVRSAFFPQQGELESQEMVRAVIAHAKASDAICILATVQFSNPDGHTDVERSIPLRGAQVLGELTSFKEIHSSADYQMPRMSYAYDRSGAIGAYAKLLPDGRFAWEPLFGSDFNATMMALSITFGEDLSRKEKAIFSRWAGLPPSSWTNPHRQIFGLAFMHYLYLARERQWRISTAVAKVASMLEAGPLPPLPRPLSNDIIDLFGRMFVDDSDSPAQWVRKPPLG